MMSFLDINFEDVRQNLFRKDKTPEISDQELSEEISGEWLNPDEGESADDVSNALPEIAGWRRADLEDSIFIEQLQTLTGNVANSLYHEKSIKELIQKCYFSIVQYDSNGDLVSFTAFDSSPDIPSTPFWHEWLDTNYKIREISSGNTLFIHYMVWQPQQEKHFLPLLLETSFSELYGYQYIIVIKPPKADVPEFYKHYFFPILPLGLEKFENRSIQLILLCLRTSVIRPLPIRIAFEHEFDVIMSMINNYMKEVQCSSASYVWDFVNFVYAKERKTLICEFDGQLAGVMVLNLMTDLDSLNEGFELGPFNGLRKMQSTSQEEDATENTFLPEKIASKDTRTTNMVMSSKLFAPTNWEVNLSKLRPKESSVIITSESHFSQFSFLRLSSNVDLIRLPQVSNKKSEFLTRIEDINVLFRTSGSTMTHFYPPAYHGQSNAFLIDFFAIDCSKIDEKQSSFDFLEAAFKVVPDREYCILLTPTDSFSGPFLDLFVRVAPRPLSCPKQELYLCHKNSLSVISMLVRHTEVRDLSDVNTFLKYVQDGETVYHDVLATFHSENKSLRSFVLTHRNRIVGVSVINLQDHMDHLRMYFDLADSTCEGCESGSEIKHLIINPKYHNRARYFVRDIMRLVDVSCLYFLNSRPWEKEYSLLTVLDEFFPIKPRGKKAGFDEFYFKEDEYRSGLNLLNPRLCGFHRIHMNIVIVVVGASQTALSFFENLIFGSESVFYNFNNLICVSPHGLESKDTDGNFQELMFPIKDNFSADYISMLSLDSRVSFVHGVMTEINRAEKYIVVNNKSTIRYDYLVLTCGMQYLLPIPEAQMVKPPKPEECRHNLRSSLARFLRRSSEEKHNSPKNLNNMFIINTRRDAHNALQAILFLKHKIKRDGKKIIVYGHDLQAFLTINTLLKLGVPGECIAFVEPFPSGTRSVTLFNDYSVDQAVLQEVKECNVSYYNDYFLYDWSVNPEDYITSIKFHSKRQQLVIPCLAFFPFLEKIVSEVTFNACNDAGLVYDGKLVINHNFRTNDQYIYAAGTFTKYARRYFANEYNHQHYNSREVGRKLADIIRGKVDPMSPDKTTEKSDLVPQMVSPVCYYCQLPGDFNLFVLRKPGKEVDLETAYNIYDYGEVLTTGDCKMKNGAGYFRLHLNSEGFVESITCYTKDEIDYVNLSCLYGLHERILNNLLTRYDTAKIPDFFEYFREPWALALYHDSFYRVRDENYKAFFQEIFESKNFYEKVVEELEANRWNILEDPIRSQLESDYRNSKIQDDIKYNLLRFLERYKKELPVYTTFSMVRNMLKKHRKS